MNDEDDTGENVDELREDIEESEDQWIPYKYLPMSFGRLSFLTKGFHAHFLFLYVVRMDE